MSRKNPTTVAPVSSFSPDDEGPAAWYAELKSQLGREPDAAQCQAWAQAHPGHDEAYLALAQAGHLYAGKHQHERALALYEQAQALRPRGAGWLTACIAGQLFDLERQDAARAACDALFQRLDQDPESDAFAYAEMADMFSDVEEPEQALRWCEAGLERYYAGVRPGDKATDMLAMRLWTARLEAREALEADPDELDGAVEAEAEQSLSTFRELIRSKLESFARPRNRPRTGALILYWHKEAFGEVLKRWPGLLEIKDYAGYCRAVEASATHAAASGVPKLYFAATSVADHEAFAAATGRDPADPATRAAFADEDAADPDTPMPWPPPRNGPCWCDSGRKYKKCCGDPRHQG